MDSLKKRFVEKKAVVGVIGLGYVGLPMAMSLVQAGFTVYGIDINPDHINKLQQGKSYIQQVEDSEIAVCIQKQFFVSTEYKNVKNMDAVLICVPTPLHASKQPDLSFIKSSMTEIMKNLTQQTLVVLESTTYPGTTRELIVERIEKELGWKVGEDIYVCYSPERVDPGNPVYNVNNTPKVIGGITKSCLELGVSLYEQFIIEVVPVKTTEIAELSKLFENTFRCVNIALVNEMTIMAERLNIDIWETAKAAATKPFGFMSFTPGPGVGGHCIPLDPMYLSWEAKRHNYFSRFIELAMEINTNMPYYVVRQITDIMALQGKALGNSKVLLVGMAYKKESNDLRESPALEVYDLLMKAGTMLDWHDPYIDSLKYEENTVHGVELTKEVLSQHDLIVITTDHNIINYDLILENAPIIYDTRNCHVLAEYNKVYRLGENIQLK